MRRIVLTAREIEAVLAVAGNAEAWETFADSVDEPEGYVDLMVNAYESGMEKLRTMLARRVSK